MSWSVVRVGSRLCCHSLEVERPVRAVNFPCEHLGKSKLRLR